MPARQSTTNPVLVVVLIVLLFLVGGAFAGLFILAKQQDKQLDTLEQNQQTIISQATSLQKTLTDALTLQSKLKMVKNMLDKHLHWTKFFAMMERATIASIYFDTTAFSAESNSVALNGHAKDYQTVARQSLSFQQDEDIENYTLSSVAIGESEENPDFPVTFSGNLEYSSDILLELPESAKTIETETSQ